MTYLKIFRLLVIFVLIVSCQENRSIKKTIYELEEAKRNKDRIVHLSLRNRGYTAIPVEIFQMKNLETLDLALNEIKNIPDDIGKLKKLKYLSLSYNLLTDIPEGIGELKNLEILFFLDNELTKFPVEICSLIHLTKVNLTANYISYVPPCIRKMKELKLLALATEDEIPLISKTQQIEIQDFLPQCSIMF